MISLFPNGCNGHHYTNSIIKAPSDFDDTLPNTIHRLFHREINCQVEVKLKYFGNSFCC